MSKFSHSTDSASLFQSSKRLMAIVARCEKFTSMCDEGVLSRSCCNSAVDQNKLDSVLLVRVEVTHYKDAADMLIQ